MIYSQQLGLPQNQLPCFLEEKFGKFEILVNNLNNK